MSRQLAIIATVCAAFVFAGCGEQTAEQKNEEKRTEIKETKRQEAAKTYKTLATQFPEHDHAGEAMQKAAELEKKK